MVVVGGCWLLFDVIGCCWVLFVVVQVVGCCWVWVSVVECHWVFLGLVVVVVVVGGVVMILCWLLSLGWRTWSGLKCGVSCSRCSTAISFDSVSVFLGWSPWMRLAMDSVLVGFPFRFLLACRVS